MRRWRWLLAAGALALAAAVLVAPRVRFWVETRNLSPDYVNWKFGGGPRPSWESMDKNLVLDRDRDSLVKGMTEGEVRARFGGLDEVLTESQRRYEKDAQRNGRAWEHLWLGPRGWSVEFKEGRATGISIIKG